MNALRLFLADEDGNNAIEYAMICSLIFLAIVGAVTLYASRTTALWSSIANHM